MMALPVTVGNIELSLSANKLTDACTTIDVDINECQLNLSKCHPDSYCNNTIGSYLCFCNIGYFGDGFINCTSKVNSLMFVLVAYQHWFRHQRV